jgi:hypothetical protein
LRAAGLIPAVFLLGWTARDQGNALIVTAPRGTVGHSHPEERLNVDGFDFDGPRLPIPKHRRLEHVERVNVSVGQQHLLCRHPG